MTRRGSEAESRQLLLAEDRVKHCQTKLSHLPTFFFHFEEPTVFYYLYIQQDAYFPSPSTGRRQCPLQATTAGSRVCSPSAKCSQQDSLAITYSRWLKISATGYYTKEDEFTTSKQQDIAITNLYRVGYQRHWLLQQEGRL